MKRTYWALAIVILASIVSSSCEKVKNAVFPNFDTKVPAIEFTVPAIPFFPGGEISLGQFTQHFNMDSAIRANSAGVFGVQNVNSIKVKEIAISVPNADQANNLSNFESARFTLSSDSNSTPVEVARLTLPESYSDSEIFATPDSPELKNYVQGTELHYQVYGTGRTPTTHPLTFSVAITVRVE